MPGTLFAVATPIGNLEDITLRALRVLKEVALVAAEDTRRTGKLLRHFSIQTRMVSLHAHNERARVPGLIRRLQAGDSIALVSDAGTPGVSDPGGLLIASAIAHGLRVEPVPGPSAVIAALTASGFSWKSFTFRGFPPIRLKDRNTWFHSLASETGVQIFFEAPHRIRRTLVDIGQYLGNRPIVVAREVSKVHEEYLRGTVAEVLEWLGEPRGEFAVVVSDTTGADETSCVRVSDAHIASLFGQTTEHTRSSRREAIRSVAAATGLSPRAVYEALERNKISVK
jgi:16S rRNA (cytidine1402-2'-O)-methyltransferase